MNELTIDEIRQQHELYYELGEKAEKLPDCPETDEIWKQREKIAKESWRFVKRFIPKDHTWEELDIIEDAVDTVFGGERTILDYLKTALMYDEDDRERENALERINDDYTLEKWSEKSVSVYRDSIQLCKDEIGEYEDHDQAARTGVYLLVERGVLDTISALANEARDYNLDFEEEEEEEEEE